MATVDKKNVLLSFCKESEDVVKQIIQKLKDEKNINLLGEERDEDGNTTEK